ncbi:MAG: hypothetical protein CMC04_04995 [Flavobacteriaceae bacterium]|nr:hypothetical protein [Flavobacteriaceae bacterium]
MFLLFKGLGLFVALLQSISGFLDLLHVNLLTLVTHLLVRSVFVSSATSSCYLVVLVAVVGAVGDVARHFI